MGVGLASAGISLGVFIGVAASFVYIILAGIKWASERLDPPQDGLDIDHCARCGSKFIDVEDGTCSMCDLTVCAHCSVQYRQSWLCATCIKLRDAELIGKNWILSNFRDKVGEVKLSASYGRRECDVRDFVEKLIENILGGRLDNVRIDYLTEDSDYVEFMERYEDVLSLTISRLITSVQLIVDGVVDEKRPSPRKIHDQLKSLIGDIIVDASSLKIPSDWEGNGRGFGSKTYEDILSTAILNKIVQNVSLATFRSSTLPTSDKLESRSIGDDIFCEEKSHDFPLSYVNNNSSPWNRRKSGMWPEFDIDILDDLLYSDNKVEDIELWKENWVLSKKSNESSVAMLIPSPNGKVRPLIGDLEVDQLSDLSDIEDQNFTLKENRKNRINSKSNGISNTDSHANHNENANILDRNEQNLNSKPKQEDDSIVEARNSVFSSTYTSDDEEMKREKDRDLPEVTHTNTTRVTIRHMESKKDATLDRKDGLSVRQLAKKFSEQTVVGQVPHSVHSLTGRNLMRERSVSPLHTNIEYWEGKAKPEKEKTNKTPSRN